ncbi:MAG: nucleotide pyrophosphatase [Crenarchaeota archaeon]|nr:nucleotide pyrophosphatase [Thermoproteota archaeon]
MANRRLLVLGLDSLPPYVLYQGHDGGGFRYIRGLVSDSRRYILRSCKPPITVPAWMVMFTGKTPGELGIYGFRHRKPGMFDAYIVNSRYIRYPTIWEEASRRGLRVGVFGVPPTYPPKPVNGFMVTDFTTPGPEKRYTWPPWLKREIEERFGPMIFDILYRSSEKDRVMRDLLKMVDKHLRVMEYLLTRKPWDLVVYVEIGIDRAHHAFWRYFDERHPRYEHHEVYSGVIPKVYSMVDEWLEKLSKTLRDTVIVIASDHGVKPMHGAFAINQWLEEEGLLRLKEKPKKPGTDLREDMIDWEHTAAWAWGGYYSRVFVNLKGREPHGIVEAEEYEDFVKELAERLRGIRGPSGEEWRNIAERPVDVYPEVNGDPPDLMLYLDDLNWRPAGTVGWPDKYLPENDRGPDDAMHDWYGVFSVYDPEGTIGRGDAGVIGIEEVYSVLSSLLFEKK